MKNKIKSFTIYNLIDPTTKEIKYVGQTTQHLKGRMKGHIRDARRFNSNKDLWVREVTSLGKRPLCNALHITDNSNEADRLERYYIKLFEAAGSLLNSTSGGVKDCTLSTDILRKMSSVQGGKVVNQFTLNGEFVKSFHTLKEAARELNKEKSNRDIRRCALGQQKTAYGYVWKYAD